MAIIRKNAKPKWYTYNGSYCLSCGETFKANERILIGKYCSKCGLKKEKEITIENRQVEWYEYRDVCVKCAKSFNEGEKILFGRFCLKCGKKWINERDLKRTRLKKARKR